MKNQSTNKREREGALKVHAWLDYKKSDSSSGLESGWHESLVLEVKSLGFAFWNFTLIRFHLPPVLAGTERKISPGRVIAS